MRKIQILYAARGQTQVFVYLYVIGVPKGGMNLLSIKISNNMVSTLSSFILIGRSLN
jgi:hypothetical protein